MHAHNSQKKEQGFTLIELLIVIGIIGFLAASVLVAVDPVKRIQDSRDARRFSEANGLLNAVLNKQVDDRRIYGASNDGYIVTHATNAQVIVTSDAGIECDAATTGVTENFPGCGKTLNTAARTITGTASASASASLVGVGTLFLTEVRVGETLRDSAGANPCIVLSIASNTALTCTATVTISGTLNLASKACVVDLSDTFTLLGTSGSSGTTVTGTATNFTAQVAVGDTLTDAGGSICVVSAVASATSLTCATAPNPVFSADVLTNVMSNPLTPNYIASIPLDPRGSGSTLCQTGCTTNGVGITTIGTTNTGYYLQRSTGNRIEVGACLGEQTTSINVKR